MNKEELKRQLDANEITQAEYDQAIAKLDGNPEPPKKDEGKIDINAILESDEFKKVLQSREDKIRTEYSNRLKDVTDKYNELKTENMTAEEKLKLKEQEIEEKARLLDEKQLEREFDYYLSNEAKLPLTLAKFIPGSDLAKKQENLKELKAVIDSFVEEQVKAKFGSQSLDFENGNNQNTLDFSKMSVDQQVVAAIQNPEAYESYINNLNKQ